MSTYETSATVEVQGQIRVTVPFAPGTEVEISVSPKTPAEAEATPSENQSLAASRERMRELFAAIKEFRMAPKIPREDLYDRRSFP